MRCEKQVHGGGCLAHTGDGRPLIVDGAIPGELVDALVVARSGGIDRARTVAAVEPSPDRVTAPCPYVGECGGCDLQHVGYARQLALKREVVGDALRRQGVATPAEIAVHGMTEPWRYRWRAEFHVVPGGDGMRDAALGFNRVRSWSAVPVDDCLIQHPTIAGAMPGLRDAVRAGGRDGLSVVHLTVGEEGSELLVHARPPRAMDPGALDAAALEAAGCGPRWSTTATTLRWRGHTFRVLPQSFIQVNREQMEVLYDRALEHLGDLRDAAVVDAYAGIGVLSVELACRVGERGRVACIESNRASASLGVLNARMNGVERRLRYDPRAVEVALPEVGAGAEAVVLDPPRAGCAGAVTGWLALAGPPRIVYVSCDPATLARDLRVLCVSGPYRLAALEIVDLFPQTHHVECIAALERSGAPRAAA